MFSALPKTLLWLATLFTLALLWKFSELASPDLVRNFPYMFPDSFDWVSNSLYALDLFGAGDFMGSPTIRQPLFPLLLTLPLKFDLPIFALIAPQLGFLGTVWLTYLILSDFNLRPTTKFYAVGILIFSHSYNSFRPYLMPDFVAIFLALVATRYYLRALASESLSLRPVILGGCFSALSGVTQFYGFFPSAVFSLIIGVRAICNLRSFTLFKVLLINLLISASMQAAWMLFKLIHFGSISATGVSHFGLLKLELTNFEYYLHVWTIFFAPLFALLLLSIPLLKRPILEQMDAPRLLYLSLINLMFACFVFFYQWKEARFTTYFFPFAVTLFALALDRTTKEIRSVTYLSLTSVIVLYLCLAPSDDLMRPKLDAQLSSLAHPKVVLSSNHLVQVFKAKAVKRLRGTDCLMRDQSGSFTAVKPECDQYIWGNIFQYLHFFRSRIDVLP